MSSKSFTIISKEQAGELKRWLPDSFDAPPPVPPVPDVPAAPLVEAEPNVGVDALTSAEHLPPPERAYPTAEEIEALHHQAYDEGYQAGRAAGEAEVQMEAQRLRALVQQLELQQATLNQVLAEDVLDFALSCARMVIIDQIRVDESRLLQTVREALASLPVRLPPYRLFLHPSDLAHAGALLADELGGDARLLEDATLQPGDCRLLTGAGDVTSSVQTRWQELLRRLAREPEQFSLQQPSAEPPN